MKDFRILNNADDIPGFISGPGDIVFGMQAVGEAHSGVGEISALASCWHPISAFHVISPSLFPSPLLFRSPLRLIPTGMLPATLVMPLLACVQVHFWGGEFLNYCLVFLFTFFFRLGAMKRGVATPQCERYSKFSVVADTRSQSRWLHFPFGLQER